ncbi:pancreatic lipase-related protein 2-like [Centruroides sculpturatus]|uniref:pancreatic lipase-related protein 2-like n=2 Tax=Centruroides sculpturatus TaxID=218467 RepID=UPI000C6DB9CC|nr:pancreatic lipase-related protein 2-like [Centruroides sculpturatus]
MKMKLFVASLIIYLPLLQDFISSLEVILDKSKATKCMGKYGCFTLESPFALSPPKRMLATLPLCPEKLVIKFFVWTRQNPEKEDVIYSHEMERIERSHFDPTKLTKFLIHGWTQHGKISWILAATKELLIHGDYNIIAVDWRIGAKSLHVKSSGNTQMAGAVTAAFVQYMKKAYRYSPEMIHLIGFSMGCQIAGYVGERIANIGRITGLDPCRLDFDHSHPVVRLDPTDALFVDVIHTDSSVTSWTKRGITHDVGHLDFYPNGGKNHPRCKGKLKKRRKRWVDFGEILYCSHVSAYHYFVASINSKCALYGYVCDSYDNFLRGKCHRGCGKNNSLCAPMGLKAIEWHHYIRPDSTKMFLQTTVDIPYCMYHYYVELVCNYRDEEMLYKYGRNNNKLFINLYGSKLQTGFQEVSFISTRFNSKPTVEFLLASKNVGVIHRVDLKWKQANEIGIYLDLCGPSYNAKQECNECSFCFKEIRIYTLETNVWNIFYSDNYTSTRNETKTFRVTPHHDSWKSSFVETSLYR